MKKIYSFVLVLMIILLSGCQSQSENAREIVFDIYKNHIEIIQEDFSLGNEFYYGGFSSYTKASDDGFKLVLLKEDIYSELIITWGDFENEVVTIDFIEILYYDFENEVYFSVESEEDAGILYQGLTYDSTVIDFSKMRIDDIQWILTNLGYEIK